MHVRVCVRVCVWCVYCIDDNYSYFIIVSVANCTGDTAAIPPPTTTESPIQVSLMWPLFGILAAVSVVAITIICVIAIYMIVQKKCRIHNNMNKKKNGMIEMRQIPGQYFMLH